MKVSQNVDDHRLVFSHEEVLSSSQIQSFFFLGGQDVGIKTQQLTKITKQLKMKMP